jgi:hypothetical protein
LTESAKPAYDKKQLQNFVATKKAIMQNMTAFYASDT